VTALATARVLRPIADPRWGQAPPGETIQLPAAEIEALRLAGLVEPIVDRPRRLRTKAANAR